jgi:hypothetical protein
MYTSRTGLILGFRGTDQSIVDDVLNGKGDLKERDNVYDGWGMVYTFGVIAPAAQWIGRLTSANAKEAKLKNRQSLELF